MSFLQDLAERQKRKNSVAPQVEAIPISLPAAHGGLAGSFREPYRVGGPLSSNITASTQSRAQLLPEPVNNYRGY